MVGIPNSQKYKSIYDKPKSLLSLIIVISNKCDKIRDLKI
jgi:hypothetical protein